MVKDFIRKLRDSQFTVFNDSVPEAIEKGDYKCLDKFAF